MTFGLNESIANEINGDKIKIVVENDNNTELLEVQEVEIQPLSSHEGDKWMGTMDTFGGTQVIHWTLRPDPRVPFIFSGKLTIRKNGTKVDEFSISGSSTTGATISDMHNLPSMSGTGYSATITGVGYSSLNGSPIFYILGDDFEHFIQ